MSDEEFKRYVEMIMSMSLDYQSGGIDRGTFTANLKVVANVLVSNG